MLQAVRIPGKESHLSNAPRIGLIAGLAWLSLYIVGCGGGGAASGSVPQPPSGPNITSLYPNTVVTGHYDALISVLGAKFVSGAVVSINGTELPTRFFSSSKLSIYFRGYQFPTPGSAIVTVTNPATGGGTASVSKGAALTFAAPNYSQTNINVTASSLVWNSTAGVLYFLVPSNSASNANSIGTLNPTTQIVTYIPVPGGNPETMKISGDDQYLYLYSKHETNVRRLRLPDLSSDILIATPGWVFDVEPAPGASGTVAVSMTHDLFNSPAIQIYDDTVPRVSPVPLAAELVDTPMLAWGADATVLYGREVNSSTGTLEYFTVDPSGVYWARSHLYPTSIGTSGISYDSVSKLLYLGNGLSNTQIVDPNADLWAGWIDSPGFTLSDPGTGKLFQSFYTEGTSGSSPGTTIASFDFASHNLIESISFTPGDAGLAPLPIRFSSNGLAFLSPAGITLITGPFVNERPAAPTGGPDGPAASTVSGQNVLVVDATASDIAANPMTGHLYLSRGGYDRTAPNTIAELDPTSGAIVRSIPATSDPGTLTVSGDGQFLYVSNLGAAGVDRYTLPNLNLSYHYSLGWNEDEGWEFGYGSFLPMELRVAPGQPHTIALQMGSIDLVGGGVSPTQRGGVRILDDSIARPSEILNWPNSSAHESIQWGATPSTLYASNNESSGGSDGLVSMSVDTQGVHPASYASFPASPYTGIHYDSVTNRVYADNGLILDSTTGAQVGTFGSFDGAVVAVDGAINKAFYLVPGSSGGVSIRAYDLKTFALVGSLDLPDVAAFPSRIVRWGSNGLAFNSADEEIWIVSGSIVK
jgi:hypothetical protein